MGRAFEVRKASMAKTALAKTKVYSKFGKEIYVAAKNGEPIIEMNVELARVVEKAKAAQVPNDIINRAIEKAKGQSDEHYDELIYEGFGPGGATLIIEALTNNVNRTISEVRNCFTKTDNKLGVNGSVAFNYTKAGILGFKDENTSEDEVLEHLLMADIDVVELEANDSEYSIIVNYADLHKAAVLIKEVYKVEKFIVNELAMMPNDYVSLGPEDQANFDKLIAMLEECEDVNEIYHNVSEKN